MIRSLTLVGVSQVALVVKNPPANAGDIRDGFSPWVKIPWRRASHSRILLWRTLWTEEPARLQRVGHDWSNWACKHTNLVKLLLSGDLGRIATVCPGNVCEAWEFVRAPLLPGLMCHAFVGREGSADLFCSSPSRQSPLLALPCQLFYSLSSWTSSLLVSSVVLALGPWVWTLQCILLLLPNSAVLCVLLSPFFPTVAAIPTMGLPGTGPPVWRDWETAPRGGPTEGSRRTICGWHPLQVCSGGRHAGTGSWMALDGPWGRRLPPNKRLLRTSGPSSYSGWNTEV